MNDSHAPTTDEEFVDHIRRTYRALDVQPGGIDTVHVLAGARHRRLRSGGAVLAAAAAVIVLALAVAQPWTGTPDSSAELPVADGPVEVLKGGMASEAWPSWTWNEWAAWSDVVVLADVTSESEEGTYSAADGSGESTIGRKVTVKVGDVLWARDSAFAVGDRVDVSAAGWVDRPGEKRVRIALETAPRLEVGRTYVLALRSAGGCDADTGGSEGWSVLGSSAAWPVSGSTIGTGESEGRTVVGDPTQAVPGSFEREMMGRTIADLRAKMADSPPAARRGCE
ncbi:hypothetical protein JK386_12650 [Nocardioides sp. zg-536]|uniref:Uncharacterized protein n=1 Tax=Nocardioides faecalis TaxID=2803858 RepID=A0A938Y2P2_9ACTN|nr:hypothetical protein [Nocardioides faecalis]MBM9460756.1 hypothetical protein [Nocardioides faecalis]MBS4752695.1 hypothetical protein [Nocardioides faecalis]QVI57950.1 hypothetical protein KG111_13025 [Nocardioides faecalis]